MAARLEEEERYLLFHLEKEPERADLLLRLCAVLNEQSKPVPHDLEERALRACLETGPERADFLSRLCTVLDLQSKPVPLDLQERTIRACLATEPERADLLSRLCAVLDLQSKPVPLDLQERTLRALLVSEPERDDLFLRLVDVLGEQDKPVSLAYQEKALQILLAREPRGDLAARLCTVLQEQEKPVTPELEELALRWSLEADPTRDDLVIRLCAVLDAQTKVIPLDLEERALRALYSAEPERNDLALRLRAVLATQGKSIPPELEAQLQLARSEYLRDRKATGTVVRSADAGVRVRRPVFVIGCGRSGTTMLFELLKGHPDLAPTTGHPGGEDHVGWITHGNAIIAGVYGDNPTRFSCCLHMTDEDVTGETINSMHRYYAEEVSAGRKDVRVLNKCPHLSNKLGYVHGIFPDAKIVHIVRNPVAMTASWVNIMNLTPDLVLHWPDVEYPCLWVFRRKGMINDRLVRNETRFYPGGGLNLFADYWATTNRNIVRQARHFGMQLLTVKYEDIISDATGTIRTITDFCELPPMDALPLSIDLARNEMRRELLEPDEAAEIRRRVGSAAAEFGYA